MGPFKAYDIRGIYKTDINEDLAYRIGRCLPALLNGKRALVGHDARTSSPSLTAELIRGLADAGCDVDDMGLASTPMVYFFTAGKNYDFSIQVTASHNPPEYNGFKISRAQARPVGYDSGLAELEKAVKNAPPAPAAVKGSVKQVAYRGEFVDFLRPWVPGLTGVKLAVDCSDGMASLVARDLLGDTPIYVASKPDGTFPSHAPNPFEPSGRTLIIDTVKKSQADAGVIYDGDADRMMLIDENGDFVRPDLMIAIMAKRFIKKGDRILHDIRTSRGVSEFLEQEGAIPAMWKVGHAFAKVKLRELNAPFGGELAGHYYFRDFFWCDSGELASLVALGEIVKARKQGLSLSELVKPIDRYANSGELNYKLEDKTGAMNRIRSHFVDKETPTAFYDFDGYRIEYKDWWFNVRLSNTEPYLRVIIEAESTDMLADKRAEIESLLK